MTKDSVDWTVVLSGPLTRRAPLLVAIEETCRIEDHDPRSSSHGLPVDENTGWVTCRTDDLDAVAALAQSHDWVLRLHWPTPPCGACGGTGALNGSTCLHCSGDGVTNKPVPPVEEVLARELADLKARLAAIEETR